MTAIETPGQYVGRSVARVEDPRFLTGGGEYVDDIHLPGMAHAAFVRSPHAHARIVRIDVERALALPGVAAVITGADLQDVPPFSASLGRAGEIAVSRPVMPIDRARFGGEPVALVVADSRYVAEDACDLVEIEWEPLPSVTDAEAALEDGAPQLHDNVPGNNAYHHSFQNGDVEKAFAEADRVFSKRFRGGRYMAAPLETRGVLAQWSETDGQMTVYTSSQVPHLLRTSIAHHLGVPEAKLRVVAPDVGGGFGMKCQVFMEEVLIPLAARRVGRPVKWIEDRSENLAASSHSKNVICDLEIAVKDDGTFLAFRGHYIGDGGAYSSIPWTMGIDASVCAILIPSIYSVRDVAYTTDNVLTNKCPNGPYRGVGWTPGHAAREALIDDIARAMDIDPVDLRLRNIIGNEPYLSATGLSYDGGSYAESLERACALLDYDAFRRRQAELRTEGRYIGVGFSPFVEPTAYGSAIAKASNMAAPLFDSMSVTMEPDGSVKVASSQHSHGQAHATVFAQIAADRLGVRFEDVVVVQGDTSSSPYGMGTFASRSAVIGGGGVMIAANDVREKLLRMAGAMLEVSPEDIELADGKASVRGVPEKSVSIGEVSMFAYYGGDKRPASVEEPSLTATRSYDPPQTYGNGTVVAIVEVDIETGHVDLQKMIAVEDCGVMLNPMIVDGQVHGAVAQGIGGAMYEECAYDGQGNFTAGTLMDYLLPSSMEVPAMDVQHIETPSPVTEGGMKGCGEAGMVSTPASIVNAVADALSPFGVTIDQTPITPDYVRELLRGASANGRRPARA